MQIDFKSSSANNLLSPAWRHRHSILTIFVVENREWLSLPVGAGSRSRVASNNLPS